jgi:hypothetical protein
MLIFITPIWANFTNVCGIHPNNGKYFEESGDSVLSELVQTINLYIVNLGEQ